MKVKVKSKSTPGNVRPRVDVTPSKGKKIKIQKRLILQDDKIVLIITEKLRNKVITVNIPY
jgi:hypothetical protein